MRNSVLLSALFAAVLATPVRNGPAADGRYTIEAEGIKAQFIEYGATLTNLWVKGKDGKDVDVVLGYDDAKFYPVDPNHPVYNSIPGRYVNRIGKAAYTIDGKTYKTEENDGPNTLHSGRNNWSYRFWNVTRSSKDSITFSIVDPSDAEIGFPTKVLSSVTYKVKKNTWDIKIEATSPDAKTPIMLTQHAYFNLDAYKDPSTDKIWEHTLHMPYSARYLEAGQDAVPSGKILTAAPGSINDFASADGITLGHAKNDPAFAGNCGADGACEGYNGQFLIDRPKGVSRDDVVLTLASKFSGIKAELRTDQVGVVIYSCNWFNGTADGASELKSTQLGVAGRKTVGRSSCVAIEAHDYVDGINHPEWKRVEQQITGPGETYKWHSSWTFGVEGKGPVTPPAPGCDA